jgi:hypothetical protein
MGAGARRPGSTVPPQGGKGGVQQPVQPTVPAQGGKGGVGPTPQVPPQGGKTPVTFPRGVGDAFPTPQITGYPPVPAQGGKGGVQHPGQVLTPNYTNPDRAPSRYGNYGFDPGLQSYLDNQYSASTMDAGTNYQYDPSTQTFTGSTMSGRYNPIPLSVMQQAAGGNRDVLNPYFQSNYPQQPTQVPAQGGKGGIDYSPYISNLPQQKTYGSVQEQNDAAARDRAARGIVGFEGPNYTGQPTQSPLDLSAIGLRGGMLYGGGGNQPAPVMPAQSPYGDNTTMMKKMLDDSARARMMAGTPIQHPLLGPPAQPQNSNATTMLAKMINDQNRARAALPPQPVKPAPQGIAQIQQFLKQQEMLRGRK